MESWESFARLEDGRGRYGRGCLEVEGVGSAVRVVGAAGVVEERRDLDFALGAEVEGEATGVATSVFVMLFLLLPPEMQEIMWLTH